MFTFPVPSFVRRRRDERARLIRIEQEVAQLRGLLCDVQHTLDTAAEAHEALEGRVKELEEAEHLTEEDVSHEIDTTIDGDDFGRKLGTLVEDQLERLDLWNDPSFTEQAEEHFKDKLPSMIAECFNSLRP